MTLTILFDLDDTLLLNNIDQFLPAYIKLLSQQLSNWPAERVNEHLLAGTQGMLRKNTPGSTLEETFNQLFYPALGTTAAEMKDKIGNFYGLVFPALQPLTQPQPSARELILRLAKSGHELNIATNPVFPATAIQQRLVWAGFPDFNQLFNIVVNFSDCHFTKPNPAFYAEILARSGWKDQPAVMIGDSLKDDILPAAQLGMPVYWITQDGTLPEGLHPLSSAGSFDEIANWIKRLESASIESPKASPQALVAILKSTPAALDTIFRSIPDHKWNEQPQSGEWSLTEILCHYRDVDREIYLPRFELVMRENNPFLPGIASDDWAKERQYHLQDGKQALVEFISARTSLVEFIEGLSPEDWQKTARHAIFGPTSLVELISFIATHDKNHIQQVRQVISV